MRIRKVEVEGMRALAGAVGLGPKTVVRGAVGAGKSSLLDAIAFAVLGYVPRFGKRGTAALMRGARLWVRCELEDGRSFSRAVVRFKGETRAEATASWARNPTDPKVAGEAILALFGASEEEAAESIDVRELLGAEPADRTRRVEAILAAAAPDPTLAIAKAGALAVLRLCGGEKLALPADVKALRELARATASSLSAGVGVAARGAWSEVAPTMRDRGIVAAVEQAKASKLKARAEAERAEAAIAGKAPVVAPPEGEVERLRARRDALARSVGAAASVATARKRAAEAEAKAESARSVEASVAAAAADATLAESIAAAERDLAGVVIPDAPKPAPFARSETHRLAAEAAEDRARSIEAEALAIETANPAAPEALPQLAPVPSDDAALNAAATAERVLREVGDSIAGRLWTERVVPLGTVVSTIRERWGDPTLDELGARFDELAASVREAMGADPAALRKQRDRLKAEAEAATERKTAVEQANGSAMAAWRERDEARKAARARAGELRAEAKTIRDGVAQRDREARDAHSAATSKLLGDYAGQVATLREQRAAIESKLGKLRAERDLRNTGAERARSERAAAEKVASELAAAVPAGGALDAAADADELEAVERELAATEQTAAQAAAFASDRSAATGSRDIEQAFAAIEWACAKVRDEAVGDRSGPVVGAMAEVLAAAGRREVPYLRSGAGKSGPEFGWTLAGEDRPVSALSGGETALFMAALAVALARVRGPEVPLLLVEAEGLVGDDGVVAAVLAALGGLDDVQVVTAGRIASIPRPWALVELAAGKPQAVPSVA